MPDPAFLKLIQPVLSLFRSFWHYLSRLFHERQAGRNVFPEGTAELVDAEFDKTIARLRGESIEDGWIQPFLTAVAHPLVTPEFLRGQEVKDWLADEHVRRDLKALATRQLL
ncbi:MAG: hypothetical protein AB7L09_13375 [Nitrospira sp.]